MSSGLPFGLEWALIDTSMTLESLDYTVTRPPPSNLRLYAKQVSNVSTLCIKNDNNVEVCLPTSGSIITGSGTPNRLVKWVTATTIGDFAPTQGSVIFAGVGGIGQEDNSNFFWDDTNNRLGIGTNSPVTFLHINGVGANSVISNSTGSGSCFGFKITGSPSVNNDLLAFHGGGGSFSGLIANRIISGGVGVFAAETWSTFGAGAYLTLETIPVGSFTRSERFRVGPSGQWGIGGANFGTAGQYKRSGGASAAPTWATIAGSEITGAAVTAGSSKITLGGTPSTAALRAFSIDVAEANINHNALLNLAVGDVHTQYAFLSGRSGGQTLIGGTAAGDDLTLRATSGVGVGSEAIILQVGNNGALEGLRVGQANSQSVVAIGTSVLDITNASTLEPRLILAGSGVNHSEQIIRFTTPGGGGATQTLSSTRGAGPNTHTAVQAGDGLGQLEFSGSDGTRFITGASMRATVETTFTTDVSLTQLSFATSPGSSPTTPVEALRMTALGSCLVGRGVSNTFLAALATTATDGFLYIPICAGNPSGTPTAFTGKVAMIYDSSNNELFIYNGAWRSTVLT